MTTEPKQIFYSDMSIEKLAEYLLGQKWHDHCEIIANYMPPYPSEKTKPKVVVRFHINVSGEDSESFLRHSRGPKQSFAWDIYGDDFQNPELALLALSQAPTPPRLMRILYVQPDKLVEVPQ